MGLLREHPDFRRLWVGDVLSKTGGQVLVLAVPVLAATTLDASTWQVGLLSALAADTARAVVLAGWLGAATAVLASVAGFFWSALWLGLIRSAEPARPSAPARHLGREIRAGIRFTLGQPFIRATTLHATSVVLFLSMRYAIETLFLLRTVGLSPAAVGLLMAGPGVGSIAGAAASALWLLAARVMWARDLAADAD